MSLDEDHVVEFHEMGLDERIVKAIARLGWKKPTAIQEQAIPFALKGKSFRSVSQVNLCHANNTIRLLYSLVRIFFLYFVLR